MQTSNGRGTNKTTFEHVLVPGYPRCINIWYNNIASKPAKRSHGDKQLHELNDPMGNPKTFWQKIKSLTGGVSPLIKISPETWFSYFKHLFAGSRNEHINNSTFDDYVTSNQFNWSASANKLMKSGVHASRIKLRAHQANKGRLRTWRNV